MKPARSSSTIAAVSLLAAGLLLASCPPANAASVAELLTIVEQKRSYDNRLATTQAMLEALSREAGQPGVDDTIRKARARLAEAAGIARDEHYEAARALVEDTNNELKTTLVRIKSRPANAGTEPTRAQGDAGSAEIRERELARREVDTTRALIDALRREPAASGDIEALEREVTAASVLLDAGKPTDALHLIDRTYARAKAVLGRVKKSTGGLTGSASLEADKEARATATDSPELRSRFTRRNESVRSLQSALQRIAEGKEQYRPLIAESEKLLGEAQQHEKSGQYPDGIATLDRAYLLLKLGIGEIRSGTEQTASKHFATPADEYRYEQARNDDYAHLIDKLIGGTPKQRNDWVATAKRSRSLRDQGEAAARTGDWKNALKRIGDSTVELKKVLRSAGFPII